MEGLEKKEMSGVGGERRGRPKYGINCVKKERKKERQQKKTKTKNRKKNKVVSFTFGCKRT